MANFNYLDFIKIPNSGDTKLYIKNKNGGIVWTISPFKVKSTFIQNNNIKINFYNTDSVLIDFNSIYESEIAISTLETYLTELRTKIPTHIDKETQLYVDNAILHGATGPITPTGLIWTGLWVSGLSYSINDTVSYASASWFCFNPTASTISPDIDTADWALLSSQGAQGNQGKQGITGPQGVTGPQGIRGEQGNKSGIQYYYDDITIGGVGLNGSLRFDNLDISSVTKIYINKLDNNGLDFSGFISLWTNSISSVKGFLSIKENSNSNSVYSVFAVMNDVIEESTYFTISVMYISCNMPANNDILAIDFLRSGRDGVQGPIGPQGYQAIFGQIGLVGGTVSVSDTSIRSNSVIILTPIGSGTGLLSVTNYTNSGFLISSSNLSDTRIVNYLVHY